MGRLGALLLSLGAISGCRQLELQSVQASPDAVLLAVPMIAQDELYECGLASVAALCAYHGVEVPAEERAALVRLAGEERGLSGGELRAALERLGLEVFLFPGTLDHQVSGLYHHVDRGRPLLVMISAGGDEHHYCLFTGYDPQHGNVYLLDPRRGRLVLPHDAFAASWARSGNFTLLCAPPPADPSPDLEQDDTP